MIMKTIYALMMVLFFASLPVGVVAPVFAQEQPGTHDLVSKMQSTLNLTQDQVTAVTSIIDKYSVKRKDLRQSMQDGSADKDSIRSQMKQLRVDENQELSKVLSADQMSQWEKMRSQEKLKHSSQGGGNADSSSGK